MLKPLKGAFALSIIGILTSDAVSIHGSRGIDSLIMIDRPEKPSLIKRQVFQTQLNPQRYPLDFTSESPSLLSSQGSDPSISSGSVPPSTYNSPPAYPPFNPPNPGEIEQLNSTTTTTTTTESFQEQQAQQQQQQQPPEINLNLDNVTFDDSRHNDTLSNSINNGIQNNGGHNDGNFGNGH